MQECYFEPKTFIDTQMLLRIILFGYFLLLSSTVFAQTEYVVGTVGAEEITYSELKENYMSSGKTDLNLQDLRDFLPLYLNYRAKLKEAEALGYMDNADLQAEYRLYSKQAAYNYWLDKYIKPELFGTYYERSKYEIKASHILISPQYDQRVATIEEAYDRAEEARQEILDGSSMDEVDGRYSSRSNGQSMGGELPWLSVGTTVAPFENALFELNEGEVSKPVETRFGVHIIKVESIRKKTPPRRVEHIFIRPTRDSTAVNTITMAYDALTSGREWDEVVREYSADETTKNKSGDIGWISYSSNYRPRFTEHIMELDPDAPYSEPFLSPYGYHIFRIDSVQSFESESQRREQLAKKFENTPYFTRNNAFVVEFLEQEYNASASQATVNDFKDWITARDSIQVSDLDLPSAMENEVVYKFNGQSFTTNDLLQFLKDSRGDRYNRSYDNRWYTNFTQKVVDDRITPLTKERFPEFRKQTRNYLDGLAIYQINDDYLWSGATVDTTILRERYKNDLSQYRVKERPYYHMFIASEDSILYEVKDLMITRGIAADSVRKSISAVAVNKDSTNTFTEPPYDQLMSMQENSFSPIFDYKNSRAMFYLNTLLPARTLTFEEAFNRLLSDYQPEREEKWLTELRDKYNITSDMQTLNKAFRNDQNL